MPSMDEAMAFSLTLSSSSIFLRSVMSTNESIMQMGSPLSFFTRLAESRTVIGEPSLRKPDTSPVQLPFSTMAWKISRASCSDCARSSADLPSTSERSLSPHIFRAASFT